MKKQLCAFAFLVCSVSLFAGGIPGGYDSDDFDDSEKKREQSMWDLLLKSFSVWSGPNSLKEEERKFIEEFLTKYRDKEERKSKWRVILTRKKSKL